MPLIIIIEGWFFENLFFINLFHFFKLAKLTNNHIIDEKGLKWLPKDLTDAPFNKSPLEIKDYRNLLNKKKIKLKLMQHKYAPRIRMNPKTYKKVH